VAVKWQKKGVMDGRAMPVILDGRIYFIDDGAKVYAFDKESGDPIGKPQKLLGTIVRGSPLVADGKLYVCSTGGWHVLAPTADGMKFVNRMRLPEADEVTASPIAWNGRIYLTTGERLICIGKADATADEAAVETVAARVAAATSGKPGEPATVQIVPAEAQIAAGGSVKLRARLFDAAGRFVKESPAEFTATVGTVAADGTFAAPAGKHAAAIVTAKVGKLAGRARIRSMPPLPWTFDFEEIALEKDAKTGVVKGEPPLPWIGMRYRYVVREVDGSKVLVKITTIPKGTRSQGWMGPIELHDYSIRADFRAAESGVGKPADPATATGADAAKTAGSETPWSCGSDPSALADHAWIADNSDETTHAVGTKAPNAWGIHDMHGNVGEWVVDQLVAGGYARQAGLPQPVPEATAIQWPTKLQQRVVRGGSYYDEPDRCRSAARRGSEDVAWKDVDPNLPKSPWWYTEDPALGVGMRVVRPFTTPDKPTQLKWWEPDIESIRLDAQDRLLQGRGARAIVDPQLPADAKAKGIGN
jgi:hypothetical protein